MHQSSIGDDQSINLEARSPIDGPTCRVPLRGSWIGVDRQKHAFAALVRIMIDSGRVAEAHVIGGEGPESCVRW